jgi:peptidoglycan/LPS O-acetylase OafA/YrhL
MALRHQPLSPLSKSAPAEAAVVPGAGGRGGKLASIQIFRGWAALLVVLSHAGTFSRSVYNESFLYGFFDFGNAGVDFFFVLSGYIIFFIHRGDLGVPERVGPFLRKRFIRIYPIYWVACLLIIPIYFLSGAEHARDPLAILTTVLLIPQDHWPVIAVAWTLTHEILFYGIFALLIWNLRASLWLVILWVAACVGCYMALLAAPTDARAVDALLPFPWKWLLHPHNLEFLLGCAAGYAVQRFRAAKLSPLLWIGAGGFVLCAALDQPGNLWKPVAVFGQPLTYGLASMLLVAGASARDLCGKRMAIPGFRLWHYLGDASYSVYLFHGISLSITTRLGRKLVELNILAPFVAMLGAVILSIAAGCAIHSLLEKPLLLFMRRFTRGAHAYAST